MFKACCIIMWPNLINMTNFPLSKGGRIKGVPLYELEVKYKKQVVYLDYFSFLSPDSNFSKFCELLEPIREMPFWFFCCHMTPVFPRVLCCLFWTLSLSHAQQFWKTKSAGKEQQNVEISLWLQAAFNGKKRSAKRTCVGWDLLLFHSVGKLVLNVSIQELKYYKWIGHH